MGWKIQSAVISGMQIWDRYGSMGPKATCGIGARCDHVVFQTPIITETCNKYVCPEPIHIVSATDTTISTSTINSFLFIFRLHRTIWASIEDLTFTLL